MILISACLAGINCKYDGGNNVVDSLKKLYEDGNAVVACPEELGGLSTPRISSERLGDKVFQKNGSDVTKEFFLGAEKSLAIFEENNCRLAVLKSNSPSCGCHKCYDGTFSHTMGTMDGVFAELLKNKGYSTMDEKDWIRENG